MTVDTATTSEADTPPHDPATQPSEPTASPTREGIAALLPFARDDAGHYVLSAVLATLGTLSQLGVFYVIYLAIRDIVAGAATLGGLLALAAVALALVVAHYTLIALSTLVSHRAAFRTLARLRLRIGRRLGRVPMGRVTGARSGEIQRTMSEDVEKLEGFLAHGIPDLVAALVTVLVTTVWMFVVDWRLALAAVACLVVSVLLSGSAMRSSQPLLGGYVAAMARMNGSVVEMVRGMPIVRTFNRTGDTFAETRDAIRAAATYQADWGLRFLPLFSASFTLAAAPAVAVVPVGALLWAADAVATADLLFFFVIGLGYGTQVTALVTFTAKLSHLSQGARLVTELDEAEVLPENEGAASADDGSVELRQVTFRYDGTERDALDGVDLHAAPGTLTALVGPSGSGKSTVARLICRFYDVDAGEVRVGGADVRDLPFSDLMDRVSFVFQETFLFDDTVEANLRLARPDATAAELEAACRAARAHEFVTALPDGYATPLGEQGARLSGGQRQRLAIARTLLKDTPIIVLDEATAFVDPENEVALQEAVDALVRDRTVIMIAHRLSTVAGADQILVLDEGRVAERGTHEELVAADGLYARMWEAFESAERIALGDAVHDRLPDAENGGPDDSAGQDPDDPRPRDAAPARAGAEQSEGEDA